eukprot:2229703-Amphidinium_carterae.1
MQAAHPREQMQVKRQCVTKSCRELLREAILSPFATNISVLENTQCCNHCEQLLIAREHALGDELSFPHQSKRKSVANDWSIWECSAVFKMKLPGK